MLVQAPVVEGPPRRELVLPAFSASVNIFDST